MFVFLILSFLYSCHKNSGSAESENQPQVILKGPAKGSTIDLTVTFSWEIRNTYGEKFQTEVCTDKGVNPFDGTNEDIFDAGVGTTSLTLTLPESRYTGQRFEWGVRIRDGSNAYISAVWWLQVR